VFCPQNVSKDQGERGGNYSFFQRSIFSDFISKFIEILKRFSYPLALSVFALAKMYRRVRVKKNNPFNFEQAEGLGG